MDNLENKIESLREKLHSLIRDKELTDNEVVFCSQELDSLLVQYEKNIFEIFSKE